MTRGKQAKKMEHKEETATTSPPSTRLVVAVAFYVFIVLAVDALASYGFNVPINWRMFQWSPASPWLVFGTTPPEWARTLPIRQIDLFKFIFWFFIPVLICLRRVEWHWFSLRTWKRNDWLLLGIMLVLGAIAVGIIPFIPSLQSTYPGLRGTSAYGKHVYFIGYLLWTASWLPGWEFMHRYFLLRPVMHRFPRYGWLIVPLCETVYHLQKPLLEAGGMAVFSLLLTWWTMKRRNMLLPFVAHLYIEILLAFALVYLL